MRRLIVGITGASGVIYGIRMLQVLRDLPDIQTHVVLTPAAKRTLAEETDWEIAAVEALADVVYTHGDIGAAIASGTFVTDGMIVAPCSIKTLSEVAHSHSGNLLSRAADVCLKEGRRVVLMVRETPLHAGHIDLMAQAARCGAVILPPMPAFYGRPRTVADIVDHGVGKALDQFRIAHSLFQRWKEPPAPSAPA